MDKFLVIRQCEFNRRAECGGEILASVTSKGYGLAAGESEAHLGSYSDLLSAIPGLSKYYHDEKYGITEAAE